MPVDLFRRVSRPVPEVDLYSKPDCGLCDEAASAVRAVFGAGRVRIISIIGDADLENLYVFRIPVLVYRGAVLAEGRIAKREARAALAQARELSMAGERTA